MSSTPQSSRIRRLPPTMAISSGRLDCCDNGRMSNKRPRQPTLCVARSNFGSFLVGCILGGSIVYTAVVLGLLVDYSTLSSLRSTVVVASTTKTSPLLRDETATLQKGSDKDDQCQISLGHYKGHESRPNQRNMGNGNGERQGGVQCLVDTKFLKLSLHTNVRLSGSTSTVNDWVWVDYHDRINVLVQTVASPEEFLIFEQTKYALEGRISLAIVGGIVEPGEDPKQPAIREVQEELHQTCLEFHFLGRFVTDVNRGMGWLNSFLATGCTSMSDTTASSSSEQGQVGALDSELQTIKRLSLEKVQQSFEQGKFLEAQWSATVGLALRHPSLHRQS